MVRRIIRQPGGLLAVARHGSAAGAGRWQRLYPVLNSILIGRFDPAESPRWLAAKMTVKECETNDDQTNSANRSAFG